MLRPSVAHPSLRQGFSLVEVLVVIVIITILGTVVAVNLFDTVDETKVASTSASIQALKSAVMKYQLDNGSIPSQRQGLEALVKPTTLPPIPNRFPQGGYLQSSQLPVDGWGRPFQYLVPGRTGQPFEIISLGKDGQLGGENFDADISSSR